MIHYSGASMVKTLDRYILKELAIPFLFAVFILTSLVLIQQMLQMMEWVLDKGVHPASVINIFLHLLPSFLILTIPLAICFSSAITFHRLASDNEILSMYAAGISLRRILMPVLVFSVLVGFMAVVMGSVAPTWGGASLKSLSMNLLKKQAGIGIHAGQFNGTFSDIVIYVEAMPTFTELRGIFIHDERKKEQPVLITARRGTLLSLPDTGTVELHLQDGELYRKSRNEIERQHLFFSTYDFKLDIATDSESPPLEPSGLSYSEIQEKVISPDKSRLSDLRLLAGFYKNYSFALAAFVFGITGTLLGILFGRLGRLSGFASALGIILLFYLLNILGDSLLTLRIAPPFVTAGLPHFILIPATIYLGLITARQS